MAGLFLFVFLLSACRGVLQGDHLAQLTLNRLANVFGYFVVHPGYSEVMHFVLSSMRENQNHAGDRDAHAGSGFIRLLQMPRVVGRSEERRVGKECRSRWS